MITVKVIHEHWAGRLRLQLRSADYEEFNDAIWLLKSTVPSFLRHWNADNKQWVLIIPAAASHFNAWLARLRDMSTVVVEDSEDNEADNWQRRQAPPRRPRRIDESYEVLHLRASAPPELVMAARKCLALIHHPDRGGDLKTMQAVNVAADEILRRLNAA